jgi:heptosyltransferase-2
VGSPDDRDLAAEIVARVRESGGAAVDATGRLSLLASTAMIARARALITNDSAPLHLGSATGTPTLAIFGPTVPDFGFGPLAPRRGVLGLESLPCRPCDRHGPQRCPLGHWRCMREIAAADVTSMLDDLLTNPDH